MTSQDHKWWYTYSQDPWQICCCESYIVVQQNNLCFEKNSSDMKSFLAYELAPQPPSLFHDGLMRKINKNVLGLLLKSRVEPKSQFPQNSMFVMDGGYLLHAVIWPPDATYDKICNSYVSYVRHHFGSNTVVVFDGYKRSNSTKAPEQQRRASKGVSRDLLLFDEQMKTVSTQASFLANAANKSRLIAMIITKFQHHGISTRQADANADSLIASTGLTVAKSEKTSYDNWHLLVILVSQATSEMNVHFCGTNPPIVHDEAIQNAIGHIKTYLMTLHAVTGCDTTSALFSHGKKKAFLLAQMS